MRQKRSMTTTFAGWLLLFFPFALFVVFIIAPICSNFSLSMQEVNMFGKNHFVGTENYRNIAEDTASLRAIAQTFFSPLLIPRIIFVIAASIALSLLIMELPLAGRVTATLVASPLVILSGAVIVSMVFGLRASASDVSAEGYALTSLNDLLLVTCLALFLPLGSMLFPGIMQGARLMVQDRSKLYGEFWSRAWRIVLAFAICVAGYSLLSYEGAYTMRSPIAPVSNIITRYFEVAFMYFKVGNGAALVGYLIVPLTLAGLGLILLLELPKSEISIRVVPKIKEKLPEGSGASAARIAGIVISALIVVIVVVLFVSVALKGSATPQGGDPRIPEAFFASMLQSLRISVPSALICLIVSMTAGFAIGYVKPHGARLFLIVIGAFLFIAPALLLIPLYISAKSLGLINSLTSVILPACVSPFGILLFTWFFRGMKDDCTGMESSGIAASLRALGKRSRVSLALFSLPILAIYLLSSMNMTLLPLVMLSKAESFPLPLYLLMTVQSSYTGLAESTLKTMSALAMLQYALPLALLVAGIVAVFPRLAVVIRKKNEAIAVHPEVLAKLAQQAGVKPAEPDSSEPAKAPSRFAWLSVFPLLLFAASLVLIIPGLSVPGFFAAGSIVAALGIIAGVFVYYVLVYSIHKTLAVATTGRYPVSPAKAILFHFIPVFNLYWIWKWTNRASTFVNERKPGLAFLPGVFLFIYYSVIAVSIIVSFTLLIDLAYIWSIFAAIITTTVLLSLSLYMSEQVKRTVAEG